MSCNISAVDYTNTIDQAHNASMNELTKMMAQMRQDSDASERFCGGSGSAARTAAASSLDVCGLQAGATGHQHRHGDKMNIDCHEKIGDQNVRACGTRDQGESVQRLVGYGRTESIRSGRLSRGTQNF